MIDFGQDVKTIISNTSFK